MGWVAGRKEDAERSGDGMSKEMAKEEWIHSIVLAEWDEWDFTEIPSVFIDFFLFIRKFF